MTTAIEWLGAFPEHEPTEATHPDALRRSALAYRLAVRLVLGDEPPGAELRVVPTPTDRPHPFEVAYEYDPGDAAAVAYAALCRTSAPSTWAAAGLTAPEDEPVRGRW